MRKQILSILIFTFCFTILLTAQNKFHPWGIGVSYNVSNMEGLFNQKFFKARNYSGGIKLHVSRYLSPSFNARLEGTYGSIYYPEVKNYPIRVPGVFKQQNFFEASYLFEYKFNNNYVFKENAYVQPYLFIGFGTNNMNHDWNTFFPWGAGLKIKCTKWLAVNLETTFKVNIDNSYNYLQHNAGFVFSLGKAVKNKGEESVISNNKKVKNDLKDLEVNNVLDSDKDGIIDANDECPFIAGIQNLNGCPDADADGIADSKDQCPNEKGLVENSGCPIIIIDTDQDGIADKDDQCPDSKGIASNYGCPEKVVLDLPKETIINTEVKTTENNNATISKSVLELFYPMSSATLTDEQKKQIDEFIASAVIENIKSVKINGFTSNTGKDALNIKLSMDRAVNIMNYIASKGISQRIINTYAYGAYNAKYNNSIPEESIKNQRVEIIVE